MPGRDLMATHISESDGMCSSKGWLMAGQLAEFNLLLYEIGISIK
jgi:hypothetical protein